MDGQTIAVAVSGGADSLYALYALSKAGHTVMAVHGRFLPPVSTAIQHDPIPGLKSACAALGVPLHCVDLVDFFDTSVIASFVQAYARGHTPNPCALCNARVKFGVLWDTARSLGAQTLATGHYAARVQHPIYGHPVYGPVLMQATDTSKDQSYFLALVDRARLAQVVFPLATVCKAEARDALYRAGIAVPIRHESQDICFVRGHYTTFIEKTAARLGIALGGHGPMLLHERRVGTHTGLWQYTEGQRRGLGVAHSAPLYVAAKDTTRNALLLHTIDTYTTQCRARDVRAHVPPSLWPAQVWVKTRYRQASVPATWHLDTADTAGTTLCVTFATPHSSPAPGQVLAVYDSAGILLAGGVIQGTS